MKITIDFRHPWSILDRIARIQREDLAGKMAARVLNVARERILIIKLAVYRDLSDLWRYHVALDENDTFPAWPGTDADNDENGQKWERLRNTHKRLKQELMKLEALVKHYEPRTYIEKELDDLTAEELRAIDDSDAEYLPNRLQRVRKALLKE